MIQAEISLRTVRMMAKEMSKAFLVPVKQVPRILFHGAILAFIIAGFWLLDSLKDPVLANIVGIEYQPIAKFCSVLFTLFVVCIYDFLSSIVDKPHLFHIVSIAFGLIFVILAALLGDPEIGFENEEKGPHRYVAWFAYFSVEAYGSLMVALFWSYTNSIMNLEEAKGAYGLIISIAQIGAIIGSTLATSARAVGISQLFLIGAMQIFAVSLLIKVYNIVFRDPATELARNRVRSMSEVMSDDDEAQKQEQSLMITTEDNISISAETAKVATSETSIDPNIPSQSRKSHYHQSKVSFMTLFSGFYEGLILVVHHPYTLKLLGVSVLFEIVVTVLDYEFKLMGARSIDLLHEANVLLPGHIGDDSTEDRFANLLGRFGQLTNTLSLLVSLFGFSFLVQKLSVQKSLMVFPTVLFITVVLSNLAPTLHVLFGIMTVLKALIFSLNEPVKELLYQPTSDAIKYKAKAWIDVFGCRLAKAAGSFITGWAAGDVEKLRQISEIPCILLSIAILALSWSIGQDFKRLVEAHVVVGLANNSEEYKQHPMGGAHPDIANQPNKFIGGIRKGLKPGDVGYDGYDLHLFDGVFEDDSDTDTEANGVNVVSK